MTNPEHLQILEQGVEAWNAWRGQHTDIKPDLGKANLGSASLDGANLLQANLRGANLRGANLAGANLAFADLDGANLTEANLFGTNLAGADFDGANLTEANLFGTNLYHADFSGANLAGADLSRADFSGANLRGANLTEANLTEANLSGANLTRADLSKVQLYGTVFGNTNLTAVWGLETCDHKGPSIIDHRTLAKSGALPLNFLRGCGLPDSLIEYLPSLLGEPIQYDSLFISYASRDQVFAERLYADLQNKGVRCWYAPEDMKIGDEFRSRIDASIHVHDRLLLILSEHSIKSRWVQKEVETAFEKEEKGNRLVLFPIRLDDVVMQIDIGWAADIRRQRHIGDFTQWKEHDAYQQAFTRLLRDLKVESKQPHG
jgi:TIR domain/Pentapeptide repeats (8 copies)